MCLFEAGILGMKGKAWMACSPDVLAVLNIEILMLSYDPLLAPFATNVPPWRSRGLYGVSISDRRHCTLASVEINTSASSSCLVRTTAAAAIDHIVCLAGDNRFNKLIPEVPVGPKLHQMIVLKRNYCGYVSADEAAILNIVVCYCDDVFR
jgi:hypothetical protein